MTNSRVMPKHGPRSRRVQYVNQAWFVNSQANSPTILLINQAMSVNDERLSVMARNHVGGVLQGPRYVSITMRLDGHRRLKR